MPKFLTVDAQLAKEVEPILDDVGIDLDTVVRMTLKRIVRDRNISFLMASQEMTTNHSSAVQTVSVDEEKMSKRQAISQFEAQGIRLSRNVTFASKNRGAYNYWANPYFFALESEWFLILNDWIKKELHLFRIPARAIKAGEMVPRMDQPDKIDLQICYNDLTYTDTRSKTSFAKYLVKTILY